MTTEEYKTFTTAIKEAPKPDPVAAAAAAARVERTTIPVRENIITPKITPAAPPVLPTLPEAPKFTPAPPAPPAQPEPEQVELTMPREIPWRMVGELYNSYIIVEQGEEAYLIDKHAAHERILFEKLKANQEKISSQMLLQPIPVRLSPEAAGELLQNKEMLEELGFEVDEFGENTVLLR